MRHPWQWATHQKQIYTELLQAKKIEPDSSRLSAEKVLILASVPLRRVDWRDRSGENNVVCVVHFSNMHPVVVFVCVCVCVLITAPGSKNNNDKTKERKTQIKRKHYRSFSELERPHPHTVNMSVEFERHCKNRNN